MVNSTLTLFKHPRIVGFDNLFREFDDLMRTERPSYPPFNIEKISEDVQHIVVALAGFTRSDIDVLVKDDILTVKSINVDNTKDDKDYIYKGIAKRAFSLDFKVGHDFEVVDDVIMEHGMLTIPLKRKAPEVVQGKSFTIR